MLDWRKAEETAGAICEQGEGLKHSLQFRGYSKSERLHDNDRAISGGTCQALVKAELLPCFLLLWEMRCDIEEATAAGEMVITQNE